MERIVIIGSGGAGKSTLAVALGERLGIPVTHLDCLYWEGDWQNVSREVFDARLRDAMSAERWILDGNYTRTMPERLAQCDTVLYLDYSTLICLIGVARRILRYRGRTRPDMGGNCRERFDFQFFTWVATYRRKNRKKTLQRLAVLPDTVRVHIFRRRRDAERFLASLPAAPSASSRKESL